MSTAIRLRCDKCWQESVSKHYGTPTDARVAEFRNGWFYDIESGEGLDLCPVCSGRDPHYWDKEPF